MPPELLTRVFEPFFQGPAPFDGMQSGLGIGLALVKQLVELHGGEVTATSAGANQGSTFTFSIPQVPGQNADLLEEPIKVQNHLKIVYVEDNADARTMMAELLSLFGLEVIEAADGAAALDIIPRVRPDVVLMDVGLPDLSGYEVARRLREDPANRSIPLIALTGYGQVQDKDAATAAGFSAHLVKPADPADILRTIEELTALPGGEDRAAR
ncbi:MAG: integral rane sensor hybrid histidine kinase [Polaromonas sp.]|nr:integral rane sensor hybrid histidine kinase [Polaromonas sp.]